MARMSRAPSLSAPSGLLPLSRPLMTAEVLDAAFRLFRAGLLRSPALLGPRGAGAGAAHAVFDLPRGRLSDSGRRHAGNHREPGGAAGFDAARRGAARHDHAAAVCAVAGRSGPVSAPRFASRCGAGPRPSSPRLARWAFRCCCLVSARCSPAYCRAMRCSWWPCRWYGPRRCSSWHCRHSGATASGRSRRSRCAVRISRRRSWRMVGAIMATTGMILVFYVLVGCSWWRC